MLIRLVFVATFHEVVLRNAVDLVKLSEVSMIVYLSDWYRGISNLIKQDVTVRYLFYCFGMLLMR